MQLTQAQIDAFERDGAFVLRDAIGPAWFLNNMVVAKHLRGTGLGSKLLTRELRERVDPSGQPSVGVSLHLSSTHALGLCLRAQPRRSTPARLRGRV